LRLGGGDLILVGLFVALAVLLRTVAARGYLPSEIPPEQGWHLAEAALWGGVMLALLVLPLRLRGLVVNRWMTRLGLLSYSIYLVHMPVLHAVFHTMPWLRPGVPRPWGAEVAAGVLAILATLCVSLVTFRVIERPFLRRKDRRRPREPASGGVEAAGAS
jgi:peptidoglycan/LPS O-acetylase OafA/YrhL